MALPKSIRNLADVFSSLPGVGPKLSSRIALYLAVSNKPLANNLSGGLEKVLNGIKECEICSNVTEDSICEFCSDENREQNSIMVVENSLDLYTIEDTGEYRGLYHVLGGVISPVNGIGPEDIHLNELIQRVEKSDAVQEIIFSLNPDLEGDSTTLYIKSELENTGKDISCTRLAKGIPTGSNIEYMSSQTILESLRSRDQI